MIPYGSIPEGIHLVPQGAGWTEFVVTNASGSTLPPKIAYPLFQTTYAHSSFIPSKSIGTNIEEETDRVQEVLKPYSKQLEQFSQAMGYALVLALRNAYAAGEDLDHVVDLFVENPEVVRENANTDLVVFPGSGLESLVRVGGLESILNARANP